MLDKAQQSDALQVEQEDHWLAAADLMAGLMMVFLLIAVVFMINAERERDKIKDVVILYDHLRTQLYQDLYNEFEQDLKAWNAELDKNLTFRFNDTSILFDQGEAQLKDKFKDILTSFFPRYVKIITADKYHDDIAEVRIEGHTSSAWNTADADEAYIRNMALSQARTRSTLAYVMSLPEVQYQKNWLRQQLTANGLSSSKLVVSANGEEDSDRSRRVEFRVRTDAESRIATILHNSLK